jgi:hypothetical protein
MVELKPKQQTKVSSKPKPSKTAMVFYNPVFERIVTVKNKDNNTKFVVSEWTVKLRCGEFYSVQKEKEVEERYRPLQEGQAIKSLTVIPSGKYFNLVSFDLGGEEEPEKQDEGSSQPSFKFDLNPSYLVCLCEDIYPVDENALVELKKKLNQLSRTRKVKLEELENLLLNFQFSNNLSITFKQIGCGYHFLPVSYVLKLFKAGFEQFCVVYGLVYPSGDYVEFKDKPHDYNSLVEVLKKHKVIIDAYKNRYENTKIC